MSDTSRTPVVLGLFAHPDDETYSAAGTFALAAARGAEVYIVSATAGEAGGDRCGGLGPGPQLAALRRRELQASCAALGAHPPRILGLPDGHLSHLPEGELSRAVVDVCESLRPDVLITLGNDGAYGHKDHLALTQAVSAGLEQLEGQRPQLLHCAFPQGLFSRLHQALLSFRGGALVAPELPCGGGILREEAHCIVDVTHAMETKRESVAAHKSQLRHGDVDSFLFDGALRALGCEEWFVVPHGLSVGPVHPIVAGD